MHSHGDKSLIKSKDFGSPGQVGGLVQSGRVRKGESGGAELMFPMIGEGKVDAKESPMLTVGWDVKQQSHMLNFFKDNVALGAPKGNKFNAKKRSERVGAAEKGGVSLEVGRANHSNSTEGVADEMDLSKLRGLRDYEYKLIESNQRSKDDMGTAMMMSSGPQVQIINEKKGRSLRRGDK